MRQKREDLSFEDLLSDTQKEVGIELSCTLIRIAQGILKAELGEVIYLLCSTLVLQGDRPDQSEIRGIDRNGVDGGVNRIIADTTEQYPVLFDRLGSQHPHRCCLERCYRILIQRDSCLIRSSRPVGKC